MQLFPPGQQNRRHGEVGHGGKLHRQHYHAPDERIHNAVAQQIAQQQRRAQRPHHPSAPTRRGLAQPIRQHIDAAEKHQRHRIQTIHDVLTSLHKPAPHMPELEAARRQGAHHIGKHEACGEQRQGHQGRRAQTALGLAGKLRVDGQGR